ncbi:MAG: hypothetical protein IT555_11005 [Acetobacteraceae bacterium]|nr:hypothetical protein [Acetobacteraceae bacterium]
MGTLQLRFAEQALAQPTRSRLAGGGIDLAAVPISAGTVMGEGISKLGDTIDRAMERQRELERRQARAADVIARQNASTRYRGALADLEGAVGSEADPGAARSSFTTAAERAAAAIEAELPEGSRARWRAQAGEMAMTRGLHVQQQGVARQQQQGLATLNDDLAGAAEDAARARNPAERAEAETRAGRSVREALEAGFLRPDRADALLRRFPRDIDRARVRGMIRLQPAAAARAIESPSEFPHLDDEDRVELGGQALNAAREVEDAAFAEAATAERDQWAALTSNAAAGMKDWWAAAATPGTDRLALVQGLDDARDFLSPASYEVARQVLRTGGATVDSPDAVADLLPRAATDEPDKFRRDAERAVAERRITPARFNDLLARNEAATGDTPQARGFRAGREALAEAFEPGAAADVPELAGGLTRARTAAMADFDAWHDRNPQATAAEVRRAADEIAGMHRPGAVAAGRASLPMPYAFEGWGETVDNDVIDAAEEALLGDLEAGTLDRAEMARAMRVIDAWRFTLGDNAGGSGRARRGNAP